MKLSDAIEKGATILGTRGPSDDDDCWVAASLGLGGTASADVVSDLYWNNPWGITSGSDMEMWLRGTIRECYHWSQVIKKLRAYSR